MLLRGRNRNYVHQRWLPASGGFRAGTIALGGALLADRAYFPCAGSHGPRLARRDRDRDVDCENRGGYEDRPQDLWGHESRFDTSTIK